MTTTISRLYNSQMEARTAVRDLEAAGLKHGDIGIVASNADNWYDAKTKTYQDLDGKDNRTEGAATGGSIGAAAGGAAGLLAGLGLIAIPGVGPVVAAGWLVATLTGALAGGATGGVIGALTQHAGLSKEDADLYAEGLRRGGAVVSARVGGCGRRPLSGGDEPLVSQSLRSRRCVSEIRLDNIRSNRAVIFRR